MGYRAYDSNSSSDCSSSHPHCLQNILTQMARPDSPMSPPKLHAHTCLLAPQQLCSLADPEKSLTTASTPARSCKIDSCKARDCSYEARCMHLSGMLAKVSCVVIVSQQQHTLTAILSDLAHRPISTLSREPNGLLMTSWHIWDIYLSMPASGRPYSLLQR